MSESAQTGSYNEASAPRQIGALADARQDAIWLRLRRRFFTSAGNVVQQSVTAASMTVNVTWPRVESDSLYGIVATPNWNTAVWVSARSTTGCTLNFGTAAPASATVDVITFRSE